MQCECWVAVLAGGPFGLLQVCPVPFEGVCRFLRLCLLFDSVSVWYLCNWFRNANQSHHILFTHRCFFDLVSHLLVRIVFANKALKA